MEELRSTEALDREILEDARKKADRILKTVEQSSSTVEAEWAAKTEADLAALHSTHDRKIAERRAEVRARLPLEKRRLRVERANKLLRSALYDYFAALEKPRMLALLESELIRRRAVLESGDFRVQTQDLSPGETRKLLAKCFPGKEFIINDIPTATGDRGSGERNLPAVVLEGVSCRVRVGLADLAEELLRDNRAELASALLGEEVVND